MNILTSFTWEVNFMQFLQSFQNNFLDKLMTFFTLCGEEIAYIVFIGLIYFSIDKNKGKKLAMVSLTALIFTPFLKGLFVRKRPYFDHENIKCIKKANDDYDLYDVANQGYSFPSMHSSVASSTYGKIIMLFKNIYVKIFFSLLIFLIGLSRTYLGVHYPTDVIAGWILGLVFLFTISFIDSKIKTNKGKNIYYITIFILALSGLFFIREKEFYVAYGAALGFYLGLLFEEKKVNFEMPNKIYKGIIRVILGGLIFFLVSKLLKLLVIKLSIESLFISLIFTLVRYLISSFIIIGVYPMIFKKIKI